MVIFHFYFQTYYGMLIFGHNIEEMNAISSSLVEVSNNFLLSKLNMQFECWAPALDLIKPSSFVYAT